MRYAQGDKENKREPEVFLQRRPLGGAVIEPRCDVLAQESEPEKRAVRIIEDIRTRKNSLDAGTRKINSADKKPPKKEDYHEPMKNHKKLDRIKIVRADRGGEEGVLLRFAVSCGRAGENWENMNKIKKKNTSIRGGPVVGKMVWPPPGQSSRERGA